MNVIEEADDEEVYCIGSFLYDGSRVRRATLHAGGSGSNGNDRIYGHTVSQQRSGSGRRASDRD
jgi:hypothetical protein